MKRSDILFASFIGCLFLPFILSGKLYAIYSEFTDGHAFTASFIKFGVLATAGEMLGLRIRTGGYIQRGFGLLPRALVWGMLGLAIKAAFIIFGKGVPAMLSATGIENPSGLLRSFSVSLFLNLFFAPVMMTLHKVTDTHIINTGGTLTGLFRRIDTASILKSINWDVHWRFVLRGTIPLFWIPAHTITFLLPERFQVLFAALLGVVLGVILAFAARAKSD